MSDARMSTPHSPDALEERAFGFSLGAALSSYPDAGLLGRAQALRPAFGDTPPAGVPELLAVAPCDGEAVEALGSEYIACFEGQRRAMPLYETELLPGRGLAKGNDLADLQGFYHAFGVDLAADEGAREMPDHLGVELEFYGFLLAKEAQLLKIEDREGVEIVHDARRKFLADHLGPFASLLADRPELPSESPYRRILGACSALVAEECRALDVVPTIAPLAPDPPEEDEMKCGALPVLP